MYLVVIFVFSVRIKYESKANTKSHSPCQKCMPPEHGYFDIFLRFMLHIEKKIGILKQHWYDMTYDIIYRICPFIKYDVIASFFFPFLFFRIWNMWGQGWFGKRSSRLPEACRAGPKYPDIIKLKFGAIPDWMKTNRICLQNESILVKDFSNDIFLKHKNCQLQTSVQLHCLKVFAWVPYLSTQRLFKTRPFTDQNSLSSIWM